MDETHTGFMGESVRKIKSVGGWPLLEAKAGYNQRSTTNNSLPLFYHTV